MFHGYVSHNQRLYDKAGELSMAVRPHLDVVAVNIDVTTMETAADIPDQKNHAKRESCPNHKSTTFNNSL